MNTRMCLVCGGYGIVSGPLTEQDAELGIVSKSVVCRECGGTGRAPEEQHAPETREESEDEVVLGEGKVHWYHVPPPSTNPPQPQPKR